MFTSREGSRTHPADCAAVVSPPPFPCCWQAQELLLHVPWPEALLAHDYGRPVYLGEACSGIPLLQPQAAGAAAAGRAATSGRLSFVLGAEGVPGGPSATGTARQARGEAQQQQQALCVPPNMELRWEGGGSEDGGDVAGGRDTALAGLRQRGPLLFRGLRVRMGINTGGAQDGAGGPHLLPVWGQVHLACRLQLVSLSSAANQTAALHVLVVL
jgi:hypothetical protein